MQQTAVVILNFNGQKYLAEYLPFLIENTPNFIRLVVADNASTDNSIEFVKQNFPQIEIITLSQNYGFAEGYNKALQQIEAENFILVNSDIKVLPNWAEPLIQALVLPNVGAVQPKIKSIQNPIAFEYAGAAGGYIDALGYPFCKGRIADFCEQDTGQYNQDANIFWASGACFAIKAKDFFEVGGFDKHFFAHMEEIDLCWRLQLLGKKNKYVAQSQVLHLGGGTLHKSNPKKTFLNFRNGLAMLYKNVADKNRFISLFKRLIFDGLIGVKFLLSGQFANFWAVIKAHFAFYGMVITKKISKNKNRNNSFELTEQYKKNILIELLKNSKLKFTDLKW